MCFRWVGWIDEWWGGLDGWWMDGCMNSGVAGCIGRLMGGWMINGWLVGEMSRWIGGQIYMGR